MTNITEKTLAAIVTENNHAVPILEKYDLDYCCKGKRTLSQACHEKGINLGDIVEELQQYSAVDEKLQSSFSTMNAEQLISYILLHHHLYVKQSMPMIMTHLEKVSSKHGDHFPYMREVMRLFAAIREEMTAHMQKEELVLFPRLKGLELSYNKKERSDIAGNYITMPIQQMEAEHDHAGELLYQIRQLTGNYAVPDEACTTFRILLAELKEFEEDLHRHVHMENNLLFPLANKMLESLRKF